MRKTVEKQIIPNDGTVSKSIKETKEILKRVRIQSARQDDKIKSLKEELAQKDEYISRLKSRLVELRKSHDQMLYEWFTAKPNTNPVKENNLIQYKVVMAEMTKTKLLLKQKPNQADICKNVEQKYKRETSLYKAFDSWKRKHPKDYQAIKAKIEREILLLINE